MRPQERGRITNTLPWHSTRATDAPVYHTDTRCPDGEAIEWEDRGPGEGGRNLCIHCTLLGLEALIARREPTMVTPPHRERLG